ncbi:uncharacterized protein LOC141719664 [Apium graveolens]|uniref:uncharacterized protein LOC141719664 n=1 Tax=Apium graveolens TaxID=4045 RepID=UPI003D7AA777
MLANVKPHLLHTPSILLKPANNDSGNQHFTRRNRFIPADIRAEKIAKGLCYFCDQKYERGHKCKFKEPQLFTVEVPGERVRNFENNWDTEEEGSVELECEGEEAGIVEEPLISVNALAGNQNFQTIRVKGCVKGKIIHILIDNGSTHNFLDEGIAKELGITIENMPTQQIIVADGNQMNCNQICRQFDWEMGNVGFSTEVMKISLGSCDMNLRMDFIINDESITLKGIPPKKMKVLEKGPSKKMMKSGAQLCFLQLVNTKLEVTEKAPDCKELNELKDQFSQVFAEPSELPPSRGILDHQIPLIPGASSVNIRPYRYPLRQKDIIEQLVQEMLDRGIIQDSASPFASPVVLVGKKDGTWRLCIDYREMNKRTVKDKFPIPVIEELMDELAGSAVFSKLDLTAGYHQMRLHKNDVFKTAFKTHTGHYEFLVMHFGLTNAPASFQRWMNNIFKPLMRKTVLVFFDDILVYSKNKTDHWIHLREVFN